MLTLHGTGIGTGIAIGTALVIKRTEPQIPEYIVPQERLEHEVARFRDAIERAREALKRVRTSAAATPAETHGFIEAHLLMLADPLITEAPVGSIRQHRYNAEWALQMHAGTLLQAFDGIDDLYLRSKKLDVQQVVDRVLTELLGSESSDRARVLSGDLQGKIIVSHDLTPADAVLLKDQQLAAFATNLGGPISHTAILARSLRVPAIVGLHGAIRYLREGDLLVVDSQHGVILGDPDARALAEYRRRQHLSATVRRQLKSLRATEPVTRDREPVTLMANIELPEDLDAVRAVGASGIGLYRTEYLFMNRAAPPSEDEQLESYAHVLTTLARPVTIRTLDLGADKQADSGRADTAINPALGLRAVRLCLREPALFRPQLRAILRASVHGEAQLMVPMLSNLYELDQVLALIDEVKQELTRQGLDFDPNLPIGGMIEVPAAAVAADLFAARLDFLSIGTNDLIQYTLAIDRGNDEVNYLYNPLHPAVLRLIDNTIRAGRHAGITVSMCGEMAGDASYTRLLLGLGLRNFSMDPTAVLEIKQQVIDADVASAHAAVRRIMSARHSARVRELVADLNAGVAG